MKLVKSLKIETPGSRQLHRSDDFLVSFEHTLHLFLVVLLLAGNALLRSAEFFLKLLCRF